MLVAVVGFLLLRKRDVPGALVLLFLPLFDNALESSGQGRLSRSRLGLLRPL
jgi:hypothetical protein